MVARSSAINYGLQLGLWSRATSLASKAESRYQYRIPRLIAMKCVLIFLVGT